MTNKQYEEFYCTYCDSQRCGSNPPETCPYWRMRTKGYDYYIEDFLGGVHTDGVGYAPDGTFCGECTRESCASCPTWLSQGNPFNNDAAAR